MPARGLPREVTQRPFDPGQLILRHCVWKTRERGQGHQRRGLGLASRLQGNTAWTDQGSSSGDSPLAPERGVRFVRPCVSVSSPCDLNTLSFDKSSARCLGAREPARHLCGAPSPCPVCAVQGRQGSASCPGARLGAGLQSRGGAWRLGKHAPAPLWRRLGVFGSAEPSWPGQGRDLVHLAVPQGPRCFPMGLGYFLELDLSPNKAMMSVIACFTCFPKR